MLEFLPAVVIGWKALLVEEPVKMGKLMKPVSFLLLGLLFLGCGKQPSEKKISPIAEAIRIELEKPEGELTQADYQNVKKLMINNFGRQVKDITLVGELTNLEVLAFAGGDISDPTPLAKLTKLRSLEISDCGLKNFSSLTVMNALEELTASNNQVSDLSSLKGLKKLRVLALNVNRIEDTSPLLGLKSLNWVNLRGNPISREALGKLKKALPKCKIVHD